MSAGFYKYEEQVVFHGTWVLNRDYQLYAETHTENEYPVDDWYWFDSRIEALKFYGIIEEEE